MSALGSLALEAGRASLRFQGFSSEHVATSRGRVHVYRARGTGSAPPLVVMHGIGSTATAFGPVMKALLPRVSSIIAPELPGHGFSDEVRPMDTPTVLATLVEALDRVLDRPAIVFGNSLGGAAALRVARDLPSKVAALVLGSPGGARMDDAALKRLLGAFDLRSHADALALVHRLFHEVPWYAPAMAPLVRMLFAREPVRALIGSFRVDDLLTPGELAALRMPVLLMWGRSERLLPRESFEFFRAHLPPHAVVEEPDEFGHCPQLDRPALLTARLAAFIDAMPR